MNRYSPLFLPARLGQQRPGVTGEHHEVLEVAAGQLRRGLQGEGHHPGGEGAEAEVPVCESVQM